MLTNLKNPTQNLKELQISINKYPSSKSIHLIDYFLIIGYEEKYIQQKIIKSIQNQEKSNNTKFKSQQYPTVLSSINSDYKDEIIDDEDIIKCIYPETPNILYNTGDNLDLDIKEKNIIFSKYDNNVINIGYAYTFYEFITMPNRTRIFIPKAFVIISQYPYFITFNQICKEIYNLFHSNNIQIPIELQLYNIVNFLPIPIDKRLDLTLFPFYDLYTINNYQSNEEFISSENQKIYSLSQNYGYNKPQINISEIFELIPIEVIVEIYLKLLTGHIISFFNNDMQLLNIVIFLFKYFLYPLSQNNNVYCFSKNQYFNDNKNIFTKDELIYGFNTDYNNISKDKITNGENKDNNIFELNYYLDLSKKCLNIEPINNLDDNSKKFDEFIKKILEDTLNDNTSGGALEGSIKKFVNDLNNIKDKIIRYGNSSNKYNFLELNNEKDFEINNNLIIQSFYQFNLYISSHYYKYYLNTNETNNNNNDTEEEKLFYNLFSKSIYSKVLNDYKNDYLINENQDNMVKIIYENILLNRKINYNNNKILDALNNLDMIELFFKGKESDKFEAVTFLEFYKYYYNNLQSYIYDIISNEYVDCITNNKSDNKDMKCFYKYKQINLNKNILLKYNYLLEQMPLEDKNKCFPYINNSLITQFETKLKIKDINNTFEQ